MSRAGFSRTSRASSGNHELGVMADPVVIVPKSINSRYASILAWVTATSSAWIMTTRSFSEKPSCFSAGLNIVLFSRFLFLPVY